MFNVQRESDLFCLIYSHCRDLEFEDMVQDEILLQERANEDETLKDIIFEYGLFHFVEKSFRSKHPELIETVHPSIEKDMRKLVKYLKEELTAYIDCCYEDDKINVKPAKKALKRAKRVYKHFCMKQRQSCD